MSAFDVVAAGIAVLAVLITGLSIQVSQLRLRHRVSFGDGGHKDLLLAVRAHGNTLEQSTLFGLLALAAANLPSPPTAVLSGACAAFVIARLVHAWALFARRLTMRQAAHALSTLVHLALALAIGWTLWLAR